MDALATEARSTASLRWSGHWIGHQARTATGTPADFLTGDGAGRSFSRSMFRQTFDLAMVPAKRRPDSPPTPATCCGSTDREVGAGPARSQPSRQRYDSYDLRRTSCRAPTSSRSWSPTTGRRRRSGSRRPAGPAPTPRWSSRHPVDDGRSSPTTAGACSARAPGRCCAGPAAAKACRSRSSTPGSSRAGGARSASTTRDWAPAPLLPAHPSGQPRPDPPAQLPLRPPAAARHLPRWSATASRRPACSTPRLGPPRRGPPTTRSIGSPRCCWKTPTATETAELPASFGVAPGSRAPLSRRLRPHRRGLRRARPPGAGRHGRRAALPGEGFSPGARRIGRGPGHRRPLRRSRRRRPLRRAGAQRPALPAPRRAR